MRFKLLLLGLCLFWTGISFAQNGEQGELTSEQLAGLKFRSIGPALMSGRIADIAIHPEDDNIWYIAVGSGGVWKTMNAGVTWTSLFDAQPVFSIGCVTIDPGNPHTIWVGTGENIGGRHVGFGDGVYRSKDGGKTWKNMGLKDSEHISKIIIHPDNSDVIWVAAQGPLWTKGGERGLYKSTDGGENWKKVLGDDEWVGVTDVVVDPRDPMRMYAATWQRHRTVAAYMGGGPGSGLHRSNDGGETWEALSSGLPKSWMGKIGLAISPQQPDVLYAAIELDRRTGGVYRSTDRGSTWEKRSNAVSGATGPHYYQELYASPHKFDRIYLVDVRMQVSDDGGKTFRRMKEEHKHSDNHALAFRKDDPDYLLVGTDGGLYESFDLEQNWRFMENLPLTQFYDIAVDDAEPFYNVYGGTQDNSTQGGPSRTDNAQGIQNGDWKIVLNWDGHQPATEPGNPDILYAQRQQGTLARVDLITGEVIDIQPQPADGEDYERFNWDAPILVSPHTPSTIYFGSQRLWMSEDRGDTWTALSEDLTRNEERLKLPIMGNQQSWDAPWDLNAMSNYNTITTVSVSPVDKNLIYVGTDDGMLAITENGGQDWNRFEAKSIGLPEFAYINDMKADRFDANVVYLAADNHKYGDFKPYVLKSTDKGKTWKTITNNIPEPNMTWDIMQDHVEKNLLFLGAEFGLFVSIDGGENWVEMKGGLPKISYRDLRIQERENDLAVATFGRGIYILDDYSVLRNVNAEQLAADATLFPVKDPWWYIPRPDLSFDEPKGDQGAGHYMALNPEFGAVFTYYLKESVMTQKEKRTEKEKVLEKAGDGKEFPGWDKVEAERREIAPKMVFIIKNAQGEVVNRVEGAAKKGFHRVAWNLRYPSPSALDLDPRGRGGQGGPPSGMLAPLGTYTVEMGQMKDGKLTMMGEPQSFTLKPLHEKTALQGAPAEEVHAFHKEYMATVRRSTAISKSVQNSYQAGESNWYCIGPYTC